MRSADSFLSVKDAVEKFSIKETAIRWWLWQGLFPVYRVGRSVFFKEQEFAEFLEQHREETKIIGGTMK